MSFPFGSISWNSYLLNIQNSIGNAAGRQIVASTQNFSEVVDRLEHLEYGNSRGLESLDRGISDSLDNLAGRFEEGLWLIADKMTEQLDVLEEISAKLDGIHNTLKSPLMTQARELSRLGTTNLKAGLYQEALDRFHQAEALNAVDAVLQFQLGKLYLYGCDSGQSYVDFEKANHHLLLAFRYAPVTNSPVLTGQIAYNLAQLYWVVASDYSQKVTECLCSISLWEAYKAKVEEMLDESEKYCLIARENWPSFLPAAYLLARIYARTGGQQEAWDELLKLIDADRRYRVKASREELFAKITPPTLADVDAIDPVYSVTACARDRACKARVLVDAALAWPLSASESETLVAFRRRIEREEKSLQSPVGNMVRVFFSSQAIIEELSGFLDQVEWRFRDENRAQSHLHYITIPNIMVQVMQLNEWKKQFGRLGPSEQLRLQEQEAEIARLRATQLPFIEGVVEFPPRPDTDIGIIHAMMPFILNG